MPKNIAIYESFLDLLDAVSRRDWASIEKIGLRAAKAEYDCGNEAMSNTIKEATKIDVSRDFDDSYLVESASGIEPAGAESPFTEGEKRLVNAVNELTNKFCGKNIKIQTWKQKIEDLETILQINQAE